MVATRTIVFGIALLAAGVASTPRSGWGETDGGTTGAADSTKKNKGEQVTAGQQKETKTDREMTRIIRQKIVKDKSLSSYAHNVKVITREGKVTLKGPVRSEEEKTKVQDLAGQVAGSDNVRSELKVAPKKK